MRDWLRMALVLLGFTPVISFLTFELMIVQGGVQRIADTFSLAVWITCAVSTARNEWLYRTAVTCR